MILKLIDFPEIIDMHNLFRKTITHPAFALGSTMLWGLLEFMALQGARRTTRISASRAKQTRADSASTIARTDRTIRAK